MATIPNLAPTMNPIVIPLEEVKEAVYDDGYYWVELRKGNYGVDEDEVFHLRAYFVNGLWIDFSAPHSLINCKFEDYNKSWRIWNLCPDWDNSEIWEG